MAESGATAGALLAAVHVACAVAWVGVTLFFAFVFAGAARALPEQDALKAARAALRPYGRLAWVLIALVALSGGASAAVELSSCGAVPRTALAKLLILVALAANRAFAGARYAGPLRHDARLASQSAIAAWRHYLRLERLNAALGLFLIVLSVAAR